MFLKQFNKLLRKPSQLKNKDFQSVMFQLNSIDYILFRKIIHFPTGDKRAEEQKKQ